MSGATSAPTTLGNWAAVARSASATAPQTPATPSSPATPASPAAPDSLAKDSVAGSLDKTAVPMAAPTSTDHASLDVKATQPEHEAAPNAPSISDASCTTHNEAPTSTTESRKDDETGSEISARPSERGTGPVQSQARTTEAGSDSRRTRRGQQPRDLTESGGDTAAEKESAPPTPKVELFEAPIPSVNPWQQRLAARNGSQPAKPTHVAAAGGISPPVPEPSAQPPQAKLNTNGESHAGNLNAEAVSDSSSPSKVAAGDGIRGQKNGSPQEKLGPRAGTATKSPLRPTDEGSWPTPETAKNTKEKEDKRKPVKGNERPVADEGDDTPAPKVKQSGKKWTKMEGFEPSVKFETQLPQHLKAGTRSRPGGRGGREGGSNRNGPNNGKSAEKGANNSTSASKGINGENRDGPRDSGTSRGTGGPSTSKRGPTDGSNARDQRKAHAPGNSRTREVSACVSSQNIFVFNHDPKRAVFSKGVSNTEQDNNQSQNQSHGTGQTHTQPSHGRERTDGRDRIRNNRPNNRNGFNGPTPQINPQTAGAFGVGAASGSNFNAQVPSTPRGQATPYTSPTARPGPFAPYGHGRNGSTTRPPRGPPRVGQSTQGTPNSRLVQGGMPFHPPNAQPVQHMPAMPGQSYQNGVSQLSPEVVVQYARLTLAAQIDWYFGPDNLVKDLYLRRHMDSQGFVPVSLVAGFNRVQALAAQHFPDQYRMQEILTACSMGSQVELFCGDDTVYRLRAKETSEKRPEQWALEMGQRVASAQNDGPTNATIIYPRSPPEAFQPHLQPPQYPTHAAPFAAAPVPVPAMAYTAVGESSYDPYLNGAAYGNGYGHGLQHQQPRQGMAGFSNGNGFGRNGTTNGASAFKADVPEFSPSGTGPFQHNSHTAFNSYQSHGPAMTPFGGFQTQDNHGVAASGQNGLGSLDMGQGVEPEAPQNPVTSPADKEAAKSVVNESQMQAHGQGGAQPSQEGLDNLVVGLSQANDIVPS